MGAAPRPLLSHGSAFREPDAGYHDPRMRIYTRKGDSGTTGLLFGGDRVSKADLRTEAYGTTDEAVAALGLARAAIGEQSPTVSRCAWRP